MSNKPQLSICVFCGSRPGTDPAFAEAARAMGTGIAEAGHRLVYGAGDVGLMGEVARAAREAGGETFGVIPVHLLSRENASRDLTGVVVTETMHERKKVMFMNAHVIATLPGGPGSLDELFEVLTWRQLGLHAKPVYLLNTAGYWTPLVELIDHQIARGFADPGFRDSLTVRDTPAEILRDLASYD